MTPNEVEAGMLVGFQPKTPDEAKRAGGDIKRAGGASSHYQTRSSGRLL